MAARAAPRRPEANCRRHTLRLWTFYGNRAVVQTCPAAGYNHFVKAVRIIGCLLLLATLLLGERRFNPPPANHASTYALHEAHNDEKVTIAADPVDAQKMSAVFKENYWEHGLFPVRLLISNDGDQTLMLQDIKIEYITARRDKLQPASNHHLSRK